MPKKFWQQTEERRHHYWKLFFFNKKLKVTKKIRKSLKWLNQSCSESQFNQKSNRKRLIARVIEVVLHNRIIFHLGQKKIPHPNDVNPLCSLTRQGFSIINSTKKKCSSNFILYTENPFLAKIITHRKSCFTLHIKELL